MKKLVLAVSLLVILVAGVIAVTYMQSEIPVTYDGRGTDVYASSRTRRAMTSPTRTARRA